ncbi:Transcription factor bHLH162 Basic helix-loop-helix protein [Vigna angularis]|uniref:Transcription factor bHLH162 Basic helix-loop-helix protein n=1 Tax=Phaseolus angularis TaxID=3914 RepID=A0A8T0LDW7_PHAAN|nr:Transcription factor bHLH162 Basic helix-loop-helix protein [Vigna angularis]
MREFDEDDRLGFSIEGGNAEGAGRVSWYVFQLYEWLIHCILMENNPSSSTSDRKLVERNRRNQMKDLFSKLNSVLPHQSSREGISRPDQIGEAIDYIKNLQIKLEKMKEKKSNLTDIVRSRTASMNMELKSPQFKIQQMGSVLEVVLVTGLDFHFIFNETIRVLQEEGSDIVNASYTVVEESVNGASRISEKLKNLCQWSVA